MGLPGESAAASLMLSLAVGCVDPGYLSLPVDRTDFESALLLAPVEPGSLVGAEVGLIGRDDSLALASDGTRTFYLAFYNEPAVELGVELPCTDCLRERTACEGCRPLPDAEALWRYDPDRAAWAPAAGPKELGWVQLSVADSRLCDQVHYQIHGAPLEQHHTFPSRPARSLALLDDDALLFPFSGQQAVCQQGPGGAPNGLWRARFDPVSGSIDLQPEPAICGGSSQAVAVARSETGRVFVLDLEGGLWERSRDGAYAPFAAPSGLSGSRTWFTLAPDAEAFFAVTSSVQAGRPDAFEHHLYSWLPGETRWTRRTVDCSTADEASGQAIGGSRVAWVGEGQAIAFGMCKEGPVRIELVGREVSVKLAPIGVAELGAIRVVVRGPRRTFLVGAGGFLLSVQPGPELVYSELRRLEPFDADGVAELADRVMVTGGNSVRSVFEGIDVCEETESNVLNLQELVASRFGVWGLVSPEPPELVLLEPFRGEP